MKLYLNLTLLFFTSFLFAQVGINTVTAKATLDVTGQPDATTIPDGVIAPKLTRAQLIQKSAYGANQRGALAYITTLNGTVNTATAAITKVGYYFFDGSVWQPMGQTTYKIGAIKYMFRDGDTQGWVRLNGRLRSSLTASQQTAAISLGFGANLPNATDCYLVQNGATLGTVSTNTNFRTINRNNLPNVTITSSTEAAHNHSFNPAAATTSGDGLHSHTNNSGDGPGGRGMIRKPLNTAENVLPTSGDTGGQGNEPDITENPEAITLGSAGDHTHTFNLPAQTSTAAGGHDHTFNLNGGVTQTPLDIRPRTIDVGVFVYLGD